MKYLKSYEDYIIGEITDDGEIIKGSTSNGEVYKNYDEFNKKSDKICYISEYGEDLDDGYTYKDFLDLAKNAIEHNYWKITPEDLANDLFDIVDWQSPETLVDEWEQRESFDIDYYRLFVDYIKRNNDDDIYNIDDYDFEEIYDTLTDEEILKIKKEYPKKFDDFLIKINSKRYNI